ncbi:unnamed protein product [Cylicocyclus nassatus]|uniref:Uncharacterized protein n=1 Tax=Cylicocyclus nassatus TaxID=53992 RepID=A0AA36GPP3_CYLNA|nr:unnamed protein product [Cylicocyclus nassatus]
MCVGYKGKNKKKDKKSNKQQKPSPVAVPKAPPPLKTPPPVAVSDLKGVNTEKKKRKEEESDNTLTDIPPYMPDMELEDFDYRQQLILDEHLL